MELTIVMPCLNEVETVAECIQKAAQFMETEHVAGEILIADNGSTDGSFQLAQQMGARVILVEQRGYGAALIAGIHASRGKYIIMGDADGSYNFSDLLPILEKLRAGDDLVMGNRFKGGIQPKAMPFLNKYLGNPVISFIGRLLFKINIGDFNCGLRGFNRLAIQSIGLCAPGMEFASEVVVKAALNALTISEVPIILWPDGRSRAPNLRRWRDGCRHLKFMFLSKYHQLRCS